MQDEGAPYGSGAKGTVLELPIWPLSQGISIPVLGPQSSVAGPATSNCMRTFLQLLEGQWVLVSICYNMAEQGELEHQLLAGTPAGCFDHWPASPVSTRAKY